MAKVITKKVLKSWGIDYKYIESFHKIKDIPELYKDKTPIK